MQYFSPITSDYTCIVCRQQQLRAKAALIRTNFALKYLPFAFFTWSGTHYDLGHANSRETVTGNPVMTPSQIKIYICTY